MIRGQGTSLSESELLQFDLTWVQRRKVTEGESSAGVWLLVGWHNLTKLISQVRQGRTDGQV